jgi:hypothetical protein
MFVLLLLLDSTRLDNKSLCIAQYNPQHRCFISSHHSVLQFSINYASKLYQYYMKLPQNALSFIYGTVFCFFGGTFPTLFAAIQAAEHAGRSTVVQALSDLAQEANYIIEESKKDDRLNTSTQSTEYMTRKAKLVLQKMNPEKVDKAISSLYRVWLSVAAVLSIQFARTISMSLAMADFLNQPGEC